MQHFQHGRALLQAALDSGVKRGRVDSVGQTAEQAASPVVEQLGGGMVWRARPGFQKRPQIGFAPRRIAEAGPDKCAFTELVQAADAIIDIAGQATTQYLGCSFVQPLLGLGHFGPRNQ